MIEGFLFWGFFIGRDLLATKAQRHEVNTIHIRVFEPLWQKDFNHPVICH